MYVSIARQKKQAVVEEMVSSNLFWGALAAVVAAVAGASPTVFGRMAGPTVESGPTLL